MKRPKIKEQIKSSIRLDSDVHEKAHEAAEQDSRSFNAEVNVLLREALEARRRKVSR